MLTCNGCHTRLSELPHGRPDAEAPSANPGAPSDGSPFPNTEPALFADAGETMAQTYTRMLGIPKPNVDIEFDDVWTDPNVRAKDASFAYAYAALTTPAPVDPGCVSNWTASCRIIVNYEMHDPSDLWSVPRLAADGVTDATCNTCHSPTVHGEPPRCPPHSSIWRTDSRPTKRTTSTVIANCCFRTTNRNRDERRIGRSPGSGIDANGNPLFQIGRETAT